MRLHTLFNRKAYGVDDCAHLAIDVQKAFITDAQRRIAASAIVYKIAPLFYTAGVPTVWPYMDWTNEGPDKACGGLWNASIAPGDWTMPKTSFSAFLHTDLHERLQESAKKILFVSGFSCLACVKGTVLDARERDYDVVLISDATDYKPDAVRAMADRGAHVTTFDKILPVLKNF